MKRCIVLILFCFAYFYARADLNDDYEWHPITLPLSPNLTEYPRYGDVPVDLYTGTLQYTIPIYDINVDGCVIPLSVIYRQWYKGCSGRKQCRTWLDS